MSQGPTEYESRRGAVREATSAARKGSLIVVTIAVVVAGLWIGLFLWHWFSLGDMGH